MRSIAAVSIFRCMTSDILTSSYSGVDLVRVVRKWQIREIVETRKGNFHVSLLSYDHFAHSVQPRGRHRGVDGRHDAHRSTEFRARRYHRQRDIPIGPGGDAADSGRCGSHRDEG